MVKISFKQQSAYRILQWNLLLFIVLHTTFCFGDGLQTPTCTTFYWLSLDHHSKAALVLKTTIGSQQLLMQLDTGSDVSGIYGRASTLSLPATLELTTEKTSFGPLALRRFDHIEPGMAGGVVGLDFFLGKRVVIDYPNRLICLLPKGSTIDTTAWHPVPARLKSSKLFLFSGHGGDSHWGYFWDTGASLYDLIVDQPDWERLTTREDRRAPTTVVAGNGWGTALTTIGTAMATPLELGSFVLPHPTVHYISEQPYRFSRYPIAAKGIIGNAPFFNRKVLIDLTSEKVLFAVSKTIEETHSQF